MNTIETLDPTPFKHLVMSIGALPTSFVDSMSYYECMAWLVAYIRDNVVPACNNNAEAIKEIQEWIETLDLQDEVDHKLDEMAASGELAEIISQYLNSTAIFGYDTVAAMKSAENLIDGSYAHTLGYYAKNDGGEALYKIRTITNDDVVDEMFIIEMGDPEDNLIAELIVNGNVNAKALGIKTGENMTAKITTALAKGYPVYFPAGTYLIASTITVGNGTSIIGDGESTIFNSSDGTTYPIFDFSSADKIYLKGFSTSNSSFKVYPTATETKTSRELMKDKTIYIENVLCNTVSDSISYKTNWQGLFINTPQPNHFSPRDFQDGKYPRYGIQLFNNSGYNAIDVDNRIQDENGDYIQVQDNSAIGIVDGVLGSAPAFFVDMHAERAAIGIKNRTATSSASSTNRPNTVYEVGYNGHLAIGCSVYDETDAAGVGTVKLKDSAPSIRMYDTAYPTHIAMYRLQNDKLQTVANGVVRSEYLNNGYHEYSYPIRIKKIADSHGGLIFSSDYANGSDMHLFAGSNGYLKLNRSNVDTAQTTDAGYVIQQCASGATADRPTSRLTNDWQTIGFRYFDTTLGKPVFWNGTGWVDATGAAA